MFDLAYTLESYDLVPATEGVLESIGKGVKAIIDFIIKKLKGAIAFLTSKKKEIVKLSENKDRIPENYTINREKASKAKSYSTDLTQSYMVLTKSLRHVLNQLGSCTSTVRFIISSSYKDGKIDSYGLELIDKINKNINEIDSCIDNMILPVLDKFNRVKEPLMSEGHVESINKAIAWVSKYCKTWEDLNKECDKHSLSNEFIQVISSVAQTNARAVDVTVKVTEALTRLTTYKSVFDDLDKRSPYKKRQVVKSK